MIKEPKYRKRLNAGQLEVLELLLRFRFGTTDLVAQALSRKNGTVIKSRLSILRDQEYIDRHYQASDRLQGSYASYYLTAKGARILKEQSEVIDIKAIYKNKIASKQLIKQSLDVFRVYLNFRKKHPEVKFFTKADLNTEAYSYFPKPLPDAFISFKSGDTTKRYFLDIFDETTLAFVIKRRIKLYGDYWESGTWDGTGANFPEIIFICMNSRQQERIQKLLKKTFDDEIVARVFIGNRLEEAFL
jgi:hypothetical protein